MNRFFSIALIATCAALAGPGFADDITPSEPFVSTARRAQVQAGIAEARSVANPWSIAYDSLAGFDSQLTRADVRAEYIASRNDVAALTGEDSGSFVLAREQGSDTQVAGLDGDAGVQ